MRTCLAIALAIVICSPVAAAPRALMTFYWTVDESSARYHGKASAELRDPAGNVIAHTTRRFKRDLVRQGTGILRDGRTLVYNRRVDGESRFRVTSAHFGLATNGCPLIPYRTIAVDPHFVQAGSKVYIPQLKGAKLPDGTIHDGMFVATDRGRFHGKHIDVFTGTGPRSARPFIRRGYGSRSRVTVRVEGTVSGCRP
jgi:3D (Asp-Asp-Asp) domain-containing protein